MTSEANVSKLGRISTFALVAGLMLAMSAGTGLAAPLNPSTFVDNGGTQHFQGGEWNDANDPGGFDIGTTTIILDSGYTFTYSGTQGFRPWEPTLGSSATFRNEGTVTYTASGRGAMYVGYGSQVGDLMVENAGVWDMTTASADLYRTWYARNPSIGRFTNTGTFLNSGGGTFGVEKGWEFYNQGGTVRVTGGSTIKLGVGDSVSQSTSGTFDSNNGTIIVRGKWSQLKGNTDGNTLRFDNNGGHLTAGAASTEIGITGLGLEWHVAPGQSNACMMQGTLGSDHYTEASTLLENTGLITMTGADFHQIRGNGTIFRNSGTFKHTSGVIRLSYGEGNVSIENDGTFRIESTGGSYGSVYGHIGARFDNLPSGVFEVLASVSTKFTGTGAASTFRNQGKVVMNDGSTMSLDAPWATDSNTLDGSGVLLEGTWDIGDGSSFDFETGAAAIVTIDSGAEVVLRGTGSMNKLGASLATVDGVLGIYDDKVFAAGASLEFNAGTLEFGLDHAGGAFDPNTRIDVTDFEIGAGAILRIVDLVDDLVVGDTFTLVNYSGTLTGSGNFTVVVQSNQAIGATVGYGDGSDDAITFTVTPEPATLALVVCGGFGVLLRRGRRR